MRLLADENMHGDIVGWLRANGHDVRYAAEEMPAQPDDSVLRTAADEDRVVITDDKDFGELVFHRLASSSGVILLRLSAPSIQTRIHYLERVWSVVERHAAGKFVVVTDDRVRVRSMRRPL